MCDTQDVARHILAMSVELRVMNKKYFDSMFITSCRVTIVGLRHGDEFREATRIIFKKVCAAAASVQLRQCYYFILFSVRLSLSL
jgi:hypothetical protein